MNEKFTWGEIREHHLLGRKAVQCPVLTTYSGVIFFRIGVNRCLLARVSMASLQPFSHFKTVSLTDSLLPSK